MTEATLVATEATLVFLKCAPKLNFDAKLSSCILPSVSSKRGITTPPSIFESRSNVTLAKVLSLQNTREIFTTLASFMSAHTSLASVLYEFAQS